MSVLKSRVVEVGGRQVHLVALALSQRRLVQVALVQVCLTAAVIVLELLGTPRDIRIYLLVFYGLWPFAVVQQTYRVLAESGERKLPAAFFSVLAFVPTFGLLAVLVANQKVTRLLEKHGGLVGFWGVPSRELVRLAESSCTRCGYDLRGLTEKTCPECGTAHPPNKS